MPAKKTAKKAAKKTAKKAVKKTAKKTATKTTKKAVTKTAERKPVTTAKTGKTVECEHCRGVGKCTYGELYDQGRHQGVFAQNRLTSCSVCLEAAGKSPNSKKLVTCSYCDGSGEVAG